MFQLNSLEDFIIFSEFLPLEYGSEIFAAFLSFRWYVFFS